MNKENTKLKIIKKWKEMQPLSCETCVCCKYYTNKFSFKEYLICKKYKKEVDVISLWSNKINFQGHKRLYDYCECKKSYPSFWKKVKFFYKKIHYCKDCLKEYFEDIRYHRFDD